MRWRPWFRVWRGSTTVWIHVDVGVSLRLDDGRDPVARNVEWPLPWPMAGFIGDHADRFTADHAWSLIAEGTATFVRRYGP